MVSASWYGRITAGEVSKMIKAIRIWIIPVASALPFLILSCDTRGSVGTRSRETASFSVDMTVVKDYSAGTNVVEIYFDRDGIPFSDATITLEGWAIPSMGGGLYFIDSPVFPIPSGLNQVAFESPDDDYSKNVTFEMPDSFEVITVNPRYNTNADDVTVRWSSSDGATSYILAVATENYYEDGTIPLRRILPAASTVFVVPDTTFEDFAGDPVYAVYYIYLIAFNEGFGPYSGIKFPVPEGLPRREISDPFGFMQYGTTAPLDSIIVRQFVPD
jgi:hypothetical protein